MQSERRTTMADNKFKLKNMAKPIENHDTAAWANQASFKAVSKVNIPDEEQVINAKNHVDSNQK